jgi:hypothetical protein
MFYFLHRKCRRHSQLLQEANAYLENVCNNLRDAVTRLSNENASLLAVKSSLELEVSALRSALAQRNQLCLTAIADHICNLPSGHSGEHKQLGDGEAVFLGR